MQTKHFVWMMILVFVALAGGFIGGRYSASGTSPNATQSAYRGQAAGGFTRGRTGSSTGAIGGGTLGTIVSKDDQSITISTQPSGSEVVFINSSTPISKTVSGTSDDLSVGTPVIVTGSANSDGTLTASSISIRAATSTGYGARQ